jgi:hypothetical protein
VKNLCFTSVARSLRHVYAKKEAKKLYYQKLISSSENKTQLAWKLINKEIGKNQAPNKITELQLGKSKITNPNYSYFITVTENMTMKKADKN